MVPCLACGDVPNFPVPVVSGFPSLACGCGGLEIEIQSFVAPAAGQRCPGFFGLMWCVNGESGSGSL